MWRARFPAYTALRVQMGVVPLGRCVKSLEQSLESRVNSTARGTHQVPPLPLARARLLKNVLWSSPRMPLSSPRTPPRGKLPPTRLIRLFPLGNLQHLPQR